MGERVQGLLGTERFTVERKIGSGGMGVVYRAFDRDRGHPVALKLLRNLDPLSIYRFKREFRALADIAHPNLVSLYELLAPDDQWFFTMELVEGVDFLSWVRGAEGGLARGTGDSSGSRGGSFVTATTQVNPATVARTGSAAPLAEQDQFDRLRAALRQLVAGIEALHAGGHLHRDIKPSNILVTPHGRVVLLDFGIVAELVRDSEHNDDARVGTPAYMAPEQAVGRPLSAASDWYSVGVLLFEALAGHRPFSKPEEVLDRHVDDLPPIDVADAAPAAPDDLVALCNALLSAEPQARPSGAAILAALADGDFDEGERRTDSGLARPGALLVGRERHLRRLDEAFNATRGGWQRTLLVHGESGMGKTSLVQFFLASLRGTHRAVVLAGRCYERESVPYKALDSLIDELTRYLLGLESRAARALVPRYAADLARLFPVLKRVAAIRRAAKEPAVVPDPFQQRRRAFAAMRDLMRRLARHHPVVLHIDDAQWGDADSASLLAELIRPPSPPAVLLIVSYRSADAEASAFLEALARDRDDLVDLEVGPLSEFEARELAQTILERLAPGADIDVDGIARESGGSPFFVEELAEHVYEVGGGFEGYPLVSQGINLDDLLRARVDDLPPAARRLLEVVAMAARPVPQSIVRSVADAGVEEGAALGLLRSRHMIRTLGPGADDAVEVYHDRIREAVVARLDAAAVRAFHRELAETMEVARTADAEMLAYHFEGAGDPQRAARHYERAAAAAFEALAFDRAAELYRRAIELRGAAMKGEQAAALHARLGDALMNAGRGAVAARAYFAAGEANPARRLEHQLAAAGQLLRSGHVDDGLAALRPVLARYRLRMPRTRRGSLASVLWWRARLSARGYDYRVQPARDVDDEQLRRAEVCWSVASSLAMSDPIRGAYFQARHLDFALRAGDETQIARGLAVQACYSAIEGFRRYQQSSRLAHRARDIARRIDDPLSLAWAYAARGLVRYHTERFRKARESYERALPLLYERTVGTAYELHGCEMFRMWCLFYLGDLDELTRRVPRLLRSAEQRGDAYAATDLQTGLANLVWLVADDPEGALGAADAARDRWTLGGFHLQEYWDLVARQNALLYLGRGGEASRTMEQWWGALRRTLLLRFHMLRLEALHLRGRCALAAGAAGVGRAERAARALEREGTGVSRAFAALLRAGAARRRGDVDAARARLQEAIGLCDEVEMRLYAAAARRALGRLIGGTAGRALVGATDDWLGMQGVVAPGKLCAVFVPGFD